jgi:hypothetical protein
MNIIHAAQAGQGGPVTIACINKATIDLGVPFDKLTATLQKCYDKHFLPVWGYPVTGCQFLRELPETLIDDLATKCGRPTHDHWTISASSGQHTSDC